MLLALLCWLLENLGLPVLLCCQLLQELCFELPEPLYFRVLLLLPEHLYWHLVFLALLCYLPHPENPALRFEHLELLCYLSVPSHLELLG